MMPPRRMHENATLCIGGRATLSRRRHAGEPVEDMTDKRICMPLRSMRGKSVRYVFALRRSLRSMQEKGLLFRCACMPSDRKGGAEPPPWGAAEKENGWKADRAFRF